MSLAEGVAPIVAVAIAVTFSSVELLTKYQERNFREIFSSGPYLAFAGLNALFCLVVYYVLPGLGSVALEPALAARLESHSMVRAVSAGLGYLVIARSSIIDLTVKGATLGVGFDGIYNSISQFLLRHHSKQINKRIRDGFAATYTRQAGEPLAFLQSARLLVSQDSEVEQKNSERLRLMLTGEPTGDQLCLSLYRLIRDLTTDEADARSQIEGSRSEIAANPHLAATLKAELPWLYS